MHRHRKHRHRRHRHRSHRVKMGKRRSRKLFSSTAQWVHPLNAHRSPMRGGFRI